MVLLPTALAIGENPALPAAIHFPERAVMHAVGAKEVDYCDWDEINGWATEIQS